jgi:hypothetical protein
MVSRTQNEIFDKGWSNKDILRLVQICIGYYFLERN